MYTNVALANVIQFQILSIISLKIRYFEKSFEYTFVNRNAPQSSSLGNDFLFVGATLSTGLTLNVKAAFIRANLCVTKSMKLK